MYLPYLITNLGIYIPGAGAPNRLFNAGSTAAPGQPLPLGGAWSAGATAWLVSSTRTLPLRLNPYTNGTLTLATANHMVVEIPSSLPMDQYTVWVYDGGVSFGAVTVNAPIVKFANSTEFAAGGTHEIHGFNLKHFGASPTVYLTPTDASSAPVAVLPDPVSNDLFLKYGPPASCVASKSYYIDVSNGYGPRVRLATPVLCLPAGTDYLGIADRVPWATKYTKGGDTYANGPGVTRDSRLAANCAATGNGTTDDAAALGNSLSTIGANGGGVLVLQAGSYLLSSPLTVPSNTFIKLLSGASFTCPATGGAGRNLFNFAGTTRSGIINFQFTNPSTTATAQADLYNTLYLNGATEFLIFGGNVNLNESSWMLLQGNTRPAVLDFTLSQGAAANASPQRGPWTFNKSTQIIIDGCTVNSTIDCSDFTQTSGTIKNNTFNWNGSLGNRQNTVSHFVAAQGAAQVALLSNSFTALYPDSNYPKILDPNYKKLGTNPNTGAPASNNGSSANDGEGIIFERPGGLENDNLCGTATAWSSTSLTDANLAGTAANPHFGSLTLPCPLVILAGTGAGQRRVITSASTTTATISQAWDVTPDATSAYSTCPWTAQNVNIAYNNFTNLKRSILLYFAHVLNTHVCHNTGYNSGSLDLAPKYTKNGNGLPRYCAFFNLYVADNTFQSDETVNGAGVGLHPLNYTQPVPLATLSFNSTFFRNTVRSANNTLPVQVDAPIAAGLNLSLQYQSAGANYQDQVPVMINTVAYGNKVLNSQYGTLVGTGSLNTLVLNASMSGNGGGNVLVDQTVSSAPRASVNTVQLDNTASDYCVAAVKKYAPWQSFQYEAAPLTVRTSVPAYNTGATAYLVQGRNFNAANGSGWLADVYMPGGAVVTFRYCVFAGATAADFVHITDDSRVVLDHCLFLFTGSAAPGVVRGRAVYAFNPRQLSVTNCYAYRTGGCKVDGYSSQALAATDTITFKYNRLDSIMGGAAVADYRQALQVSNVTELAGVEIAWNQVLNEPNYSRVEDNFSFAQASGTSASPMNVHHNLVSGAYPFPVNATGYTGSGLTIEASAANLALTQYPHNINAHDNYVLRCLNSGINFAAGYNATATNNDVVSAGVTPGGIVLASAYTGLGLFKGQAGYTDANFHDLVMSGNRVNVSPRGYSLPVPAGAPNSTVFGSGNDTNLYAATGLVADEEAKFSAWVANLAATQTLIGA